MAPRYVLILSEQDPVANGVAEALGQLPRTGLVIGGAPAQVVGDGVLAVRRPGFHIHDAQLASDLPPEWLAARTTLIFPSIHQSAEGPLCFTVHPLGNWGETAEVGGAPRSLVPTNPRLMAAALRAFTAAAEPFGLSATFEATHHGPVLPLPAFFAEIGGGPDPLHPAPEHVRALAVALRDLREDPADRVALAVGGGHYAPHFTDLVRKRRWAVGHIVPRHALDGIPVTLAEAAWNGTPGAEGILYARAADVKRPEWSRLGPRLRDADAPLRE
jgi:D-tyrosyl-tRNA(Tyr) deacylase